jgi:hypothetical protein
MAQYQIEVKGLKELQGKLDDVEWAAAPIHRFFQRSGNAIQGNAVPLVPTDRGRLRDSLNANTAVKISGRVPTPDYVSVGTNVKYAKYVEFGRDPGKPAPPVAQIEAWLRRKNKVGKQARTMIDRNGNSVPVRSLAFLIARSIGRKGIEARPFLRDGAEQSIPQIERYVSVLASELEEAARNAR